ncbi:protein of unknown function [Bradyrhizobium sp. ORS 285]|nr:protein of unknown function [Bradyrhizobium sp. ORS 285]
MPSKLDPHLATIESWLAVEPQLTALTIVGRLTTIDPLTFSDKQDSIVQRLLRSLRRKVAETAIVSMPVDEIRPGAVDGAACDEHSAPPTPPSKPSWPRPETGLGRFVDLRPGNILAEAIRGVNFERRLILGARSPATNVTREL